jgi:hypothetical protein
MAHIVKVKLLLILVSICILVVIPLLENNFFDPVTIKRWQELDWDDFTGIPKPFTKWDAGISSTVYLEYDSTSQLFVAYAGQNNQRSYVKRKSNDSDYLLNHEQYHFNITELHARMMNVYLQNNPSVGESDHYMYLSTLRSELEKMHSQYDKETNHSLKVSMQRRWEYKVDSMLLEYSPDSGWIHDELHGVNVFFPVQPEFLSGISEEGYPYRLYQLEKYDVLLYAVIISQTVDDVGLLENNLYEYNKNKSNKITSVIMNSDRFEFEALVKGTDSTNEHKFHELWVYHKDVIVYLAAYYPNSHEDL